MAATETAGGLLQFGDFTLPDRVYLPALVIFGSNDNIFEIKHVFDYINGERQVLWKAVGSTSVLEGTKFIIPLSVMEAYYSTIHQQPIKGLILKREGGTLVEMSHLTNFINQNYHRDYHMTRKSYLKNPHERILTVPEFLWPFITNAEQEINRKLASTLPMRKLSPTDTAFAKEVACAVAKEISGSAAGYQLCQLMLRTLNTSTVNSYCIGIDPNVELSIAKNVHLVKPPTRRAKKAATETSVQSGPIYNTGAIPFSIPIATNSNTLHTGVRGSIMT